VNRNKLHGLLQRDHGKADFQAPEMTDFGMG